MSTTSAGPTQAQIDAVVAAYRASQERNTEELVCNWADAVDDAAEAAGLEVVHQDEQDVTDTGPLVRVLLVNGEQWDIIFPEDDAPAYAVEVRS